jgi:hypothetical protein
MTVRIGRCHHKHQVKVSWIGQNRKLISCIFPNDFDLNLFSGVPGFSAAMIRHLQSLRRMQRDHGWVHTLLVSSNKIKLQWRPLNVIADMLSFG